MKKRKGKPLPPINWREGGFDDYDGWQEASSGDGMPGQILVTIKRSRGVHIRVSVHEHIEVQTDFGRSLSLRLIKRERQTCENNEHADFAFRRAVERCELLLHQHAAKLARAKK